MALNFQKATEVPSLSVNNITGVFSGSDDPSVTDQGDLTAAPQGSVYIRNTGEVFQKFGTGNLDWGYFKADPYLLDTNGSHYTHIVSGSNITAARILTLITADANQTLTITGSPTINDWFDQNVKTTASPTFAQVDGGNLRITGNTLSSTDTNGHVKIDPNGIGGVGVGLGGLNPSATLHVSSDGSLFSGTNSGTVATFQKVTAANANIGVVSSNTGTCSFDFGDTDLRNPGSVVYNHSNNEMSFNANTVEVMRLYPSKRVTIGNTNSSTSAKLYVYASGTPLAYFSDSVLVLQRTALGDNARLALTGSSTGLSILDMGDEVDQRTQNITCSNVDNSMRFSTNLIERMRIDSSGNVGIGTTSPAVKLHINLDGTSLIPAISASTTGLFHSAGDTSLSVLSGNAFTSTLHLGDNDDENICNIAYDNSLNRMSVVVNNSEAMAIGNNTHIGIGRDWATNHLVAIDKVATDKSVGTALNVRSIPTNTISATNFLTSIAGLLNDYTIPVSTTDSGYRIGVNASGYSTTTGFAGTLSENYGVWARAGISVSASTAVVSNAYAVHAQILGSQTGATITNAYGVYIDNSSTSSTITNRFDLYASSPSAKSYFAGKVGIGTTNVPAKLTTLLSGSLSTTNITSNVASFQKTDGQAEVSIIGSTTTASVLYFGDTSAGTSGGIVYGHDADYMYFRTNLTERMRIDSSGNVGIGTTSPSTPLHVLSGGIAATGSASMVSIFQRSAAGNSMSIELVSSNTGSTTLGFGDTDNLQTGKINYSHSSNNMTFTTNSSEAMRIDSSGNVGIGTTSPLSKLHVKQGSTTAAIPTLKLEQLDVDDSFIDFVGTANGTTGSVLTGKTAHGGTINFAKCEINGVVYYLQLSTAPV